MVYQKKAVCRIEGDERAEYEAYMMRPARLELLIERLFDLLGTAKIELEEATFRVRERRGLAGGTGKMFYDKHTGEFYERIWVGDKPVEIGEASGG